MGWSRERDWNEVWHWCFKEVKEKDMDSGVPPRLDHQTYSERIVDEILCDLCGRRGLRQEWDMIDEDIQEEIIDTWVMIVRRVLMMDQSNA